MYGRYTGDMGLGLAAHIDLGARRTLTPPLTLALTLTLVHSARASSSSVQPSSSAAAAAAACIYVEAH